MSGLHVPHSFPKGTKVLQNACNLLTHKLVVVLDCEFLLPLGYWF